MRQFLWLIMALGGLCGGASAGEFTVRDPLATATVLLQAAVAFAPPLVFGRPRDDLEPELTALHDLLVHGLVRAK